MGVLSFRSDKLNVPHTIGYYRGLNVINSFINDPIVQLRHG